MTDKKIPFRHRVLDEGTWRAFHRHQARGERIRLIRNGTIVPAYRMQPQLLVKDEKGRWCPELKIMSSGHTVAGAT